jgi:hypothetical protein
MTTQSHVNELDNSVLVACAAYSLHAQWLQVYFCGGIQDQAATIARCSLYDHSSNSWAAAAQVRLCMFHQTKMLAVHVSNGCT